MVFLPATAGALAEFFFAFQPKSTLKKSLVVDTPLKEIRLYTPVYVPFTAKIGHFRQSCKGISCMGSS